MSAISPEDRAVVDLAAVFAPHQASSFLSRLATSDPQALLEHAARAAGAPRRERLAALAATLAVPCSVAASVEPLAALERPRTSAALRTFSELPQRRPGASGTPAFRRLVLERLSAAPDRAADARPGRVPRRPVRAARPRACDAGTERELHGPMALPFEMPSVSAGFAQLTPAACGVGEKAALAASRAISSLTGGQVTITGRALPCVPAPAVGAVRLRVELTALPGTAALEVDAKLAAALLDRLVGAPGDPDPASEVTPLERAALDLAVLASLDAVAAVPEVEARLAPRLARLSCEPLGGLAVELSVTLGEVPGRARAILPPAAVRALGAATTASLPAAGIGLELSLRGGSAPLTLEDLRTLEPGDVVLLDRSPAARLSAVAPGGLRLEGIETDGNLHIEEIRMPDTSSNYPVALEVELARVPVTLGDLARLEPGAVLPLPIDRRGLVALKLGERTIGRGQLVDVEGAVGVRIDSLTEGLR